MAQEVQSHLLETVTGWEDFFLLSLLSLPSLLYNTRCVCYHSIVPALVVVWFFLRVSLLNLCA